MSDAILITLIGGAFSLAGILLKAKMDRIQKDLDAYKAREAQNRTDLIFLGESQANLRSDNSKLVLLINQLFNEFKTVTGEEPTVDLTMVRHMIDLYYVTGQLPKLDQQQIAMIRRASE